MGARDISGEMLRVCFGAVRKESTPAKILRWTLDEMASCQRDMDITGDMDSHDYYAGMIDAFEMVSLWIAPLKEDKEPLFNQLLSKTGTRFPKKETAA